MDQGKSVDISGLYEQLVNAHPTLLRLLVWQQGKLLLDSSNPHARLDAETNLLKKFANAIIHLMPFMRSPLSDFHGELKNVRSVTKTITSLLAGAVFGQDILAHLEDPIRLYFPEIPADDPKAAIRLKHLLSNTSGLPTVDDLKSMRSLLSTANWLQTILRYPLQDQPGRNYYYSSANFHLTNCLLERVLGSRLLQYAEAQLFQPLGIQDMFWACDPQGVPFGGSDLYLHPEDMLKIGILCQQHGKWQGQQIIPQQWLDVATRPVVKVDEADRYGYGWWVDHNVEQGCLPSYSACGVGGQRIIIIPDKECIVVSTALTSLHAHSNSVDDLVCAYFSK
ncbi:MAG: serine hydrolase [Chloroflexi bacterium]|nr:serine hydrolase [Chloroflexota bacterium]